MDYPRGQIELTTRINLLQPEVIRNTVKIRFDFNVDEYLSDSTGFQILIGTEQSSPPRLIEFNLSSTDLRQIHENLAIRKASSSPQTSLVLLLPTMEWAFINLGIDFLVTLTYQRVLYIDFDLSSFLGEDDVVGRLVREGEIDEEISKSLDLESKSCTQSVLRIFWVL
ncbi:unnamed protein product [Arabis nemorensis]|uniref:Uncharacterized protein n=1 Tax=Arabis nemorensis TaxID=586526 RepID=A0A565AN24_9BRAS|nr:unnamed protein product [Arabis nemorensis]